MAGDGGDAGPGPHFGPGRARAEAAATAAAAEREAARTAHRGEDTKRAVSLGSLKTDEKSEVRKKRGDAVWDWLWKFLLPLKFLASKCMFLLRSAKRT